MTRVIFISSCRLLLLYSYMSKEQPVFMLTKLPSMLNKISRFSKACFIFILTNIAITRTSETFFTSIF